MVESDPSTLWIRCEASEHIGTGHAMRCQSLAAACRRVGWNACFLTNDVAPKLVPSLKSNRNHTRTGSDFDLANAILEQGNPDADWVVWDGYRFDAADHGPLRSKGFRTLVIDDMANRHYDCDLLLDQTLNRSAADYAGRVNSNARLLLGPGFALLRDEFKARTAQQSARRCIRPTKRVFVGFGGTDFGGATAKVMQALANEPAHFIVVLGAGAPTSSVAAMRRIMRSNANVELHVDPRNYVDLLASCDLALGAAGTSVWERCALKIPSLLAVLADNQRLICAKMIEAGAAGPLDVTSADSIRRDFRALSSDDAALQKMSEAAGTICDGQGAKRVAGSLAEYGRKQT